VAATSWTGNNDVKTCTPHLTVSRCGPNGVNVSAWASFRNWSLDHKLTFFGIVSSAIVALAVAVIPLFTSGGNGRSVVTNYSQYAKGHSTINNGIINNNNNYGPTAGGTGLSKDPQARIVQLTGSWSVQGFHDAIVDRDTRIVALYLETGMTAKTVDKSASAILFGFQGVPMSGDPVALVKTFQAGGFKVDDELKDSYLMGALTDNLFPLQFHTDLAPKGYTGGYQDGTFVGSLLFWIVQRALGTGPTDQDIQVIKYLISQGADCKVPLSFMNYNSNTLAGTTGELLPMMQSCAK
jgi:hypothetical protein